MRNAFINGLLDKAKSDKKIVLITGDLGYGVVDDFARELPNQFINIGINEQSMMSVAAGLASQGYKPFVYSIANFPTFRCLEQIRNDVCYMNLDVTIVAVGAGLAYGTAGYSHHLIEDISSLSTFRNLIIYSPSDTLETELSLNQIAAHSGPQYIRLGKGGEGKLVEGFKQELDAASVDFGKGELGIIATGNILTEAIELKALLKEFDPTLISVYNLSKLEEILLKHRFEKIIVLEEHILRGGFGSAILEIFENHPTKIKRFGIECINSTFSGDQKHLRAKYGLTSPQILEILNQESFLH